MSSTILPINNISSAGLENSTRPLVFTSTSGCRASENFDIFSEKYFFPIYMSIIFVMQGKCLFSDISRPGLYGVFQVVKTDSKHQALMSSTILPINNILPVWCISGGGQQRVRAKLL